MESSIYKNQYGGRAAFLYTAIIEGLERKPRSSGFHLAGLCMAGQPSLRMHASDCYNRQGLEALCNQRLSDYV